MFLKTTLFAIVLTGFVVFFVNCTQAAVLTFDDISTNEYGQIPDDYGDFTWNHTSIEGVFYYVDIQQQTVDSGFINGVVSGNYVAFPTSYSHAGIGGIIATDEFIFYGAYFTAAWRDSLNVQVDGYFDDNLLYSTTIEIDTTGPTWFQFDYENINKLNFSASGGIQHEGYEYDNTQFVIDDFTYIPEPTMILLFTVGGLLLRKIHKQL